MPKTTSVIAEDAQTVSQEQVDTAQAAMGCVLKGGTPRSPSPSHCKTHHRMVWHAAEVKGCKTAYEAAVNHMQGR